MSTPAHPGAHAASATWPAGVDDRGSAHLGGRHAKTAAGVPVGFAWWQRYLVFAVAVSILFFVFPAYHLLLWTLLGLSCVVATVVGVIRYRPSHRSAWYLLAVAEFSFIVGDTAYNLLVEVLHQDDPLPSIADVFYLATYPLVAVALFLFMGGRSSPRDWASLIDGLIFITGLGLLAWVFLMVSNFEAGNLTLAQRLISVAYPLGDVLVVAMPARLVANGGLRVRSMQFLLLGAAGLLIANVLYGLIRLNGAWYVVGGPVDSGWVLFYLAWGCAALHPSMATIGQIPPPRSDQTGGLRMAGLAVVSLIAAAVFMTSAQPAATVGLFAAALFLLVIARLRLLLGVYHRSVARERTLRSTSQTLVAAPGLPDIYQVALDGARALIRTRAQIHVGIYVCRADEVMFLAGTGPEHDASSRAELWQSAAAGGLLDAAGTLSVTPLHVGADEPGMLVVETATPLTLDQHEALATLAAQVTLAVTSAHLADDLRRRAFHDSLTGLPNRALFQHRAQHALNMATRNGTCVAMLLLDLDDFKSVNDTHGHRTGDEVLRDVAARMQAALPHDAAVSRFNGDEFAVLIEDLTDADQADGLAERMGRSFLEPFTVDGEALTVHASIGLAVTGTTDDTMDLTRLLQSADLALRAAKEGGGGQTVRFHPDLHTRKLDRITLRRDLERAVAAGKFILQYQPVVSIDTGRITGCEALIRWQHPTRGLLPPGEFVALAEETGLIVDLGRWVLDQACAQARAWTEAGHRHLAMAVNVSAYQLHETGFLDDVRSALRKHRLDPGQLVLELTESIFADDTYATAEQLRALRESGVKIAIDDFGTGYSSLSYLQKFNFDILKIDKSFVDALGRSDANARAMVQAIIFLADALHLDVIAEGIERPEQRDELRTLRCRSGQGYLYSKPVDADRMTVLLKQPPQTWADRGPR